MKIAYKCPNCNHKESVSISIQLLILCIILSLFLALIPIIIWCINWYKMTNCPKCGTRMQRITNVNPD